MNDNIIRIYTTMFTKQWSEDDFNHLLSFIPKSHHPRILKEEDWEQRQGILARKLLLLHGLKHFGCDMKDILESVQRMPSGKPYIVDTPNFSVTNDSSVAAAALSETSIIGLDIERMKPIDLSEYREEMTYLEWREIYSHVIPMRRFYEFWTIKESVLKADGEVKNLNIKEIFIQPDVAISNAKYWYLHPLEIEYYGYVGFVACSNPDPEIELIEVDLLEVYPRS